MSTFVRNSRHVIAIIHHAVYRTRAVLCITRFDPPAIGTNGSSQDARGLFSALSNSLYRIPFYCYNGTVNSVFILLSER